MSKMTPGFTGRALRVVLAAPRTRVVWTEPNGRWSKTTGYLPSFRAFTALGRYTNLCWQPELVKTSTMPKKRTLSICRKPSERQPCLLLTVNIRIRRLPSILLWPLVSPNDRKLPKWPSARGASFHYHRGDSDSFTRQFIGTILCLWASAT